MNRKAILFDLDGTLWSSVDCVADIWNRVLEKRGLNVHISRERCASFMGKTMEVIMAELLPDADNALRDEVIREFAEEEVFYLRQYGAVLYHRLEETLAVLSGSYRLCIVSNCQEGYIQAFLHAHKLEEIFDDFESAGRTGLEKSENIRLLMSRGGITSAVYVGDTAGDERAARAAGIPFLWASYGFGTAESPDGVISGVWQLPALLEKMKF